MKFGGYVKNMYSHISVNADSAERGRREATQRDDFWTCLAAEIVIRAVEDWRDLVKQKKWNVSDRERYCNFEELRKFFKSEWCEFLMQDFEIEPERLIELLEAELKKAQLQAEKEATKNMKQKGVKK